MALQDERASVVLRPSRRMGLYLKRAFDLVATVLILPIATPTLFMCAVLIRAESRGPVFYRQDRVGYLGKKFSILKLRTMTHGSTHGNEHLLEVLDRTDLTGGQYKTGMDKRLTRVGKLLRKSSLDELPQLINVLRGEMSLVGPRPHTPDEVEKFPAKYSSRHDLPPGITGLWQVSGRNRLSALAMLDLDLHYVRYWSLWRDLKIIAATVPAVFRFQDTE